MHPSSTPWKHQKTGTFNPSLIYTMSYKFILNPQQLDKSSNSFMLYRGGNYNQDLYNNAFSKRGIEKFLFCKIVYKLSVYYFTTVAFEAPLKFCYVKFYFTEFYL